MGKASKLKLSFNCQISYLFIFIQSINTSLIFVNIHYLELKLRNLTLFMWENMSQVASKIWKPITKKLPEINLQYLTVQRSDSALNWKKIRLNLFKNFWDWGF